MNLKSFLKRLLKNLVNLLMDLKLKTEKGNAMNT